MKKVLFFLFVSCVMGINAEHAKNNQQTHGNPAKNKQMVSLHCGAGTQPSCTKIGNKRNFKCVCRPLKK